MASNIEASELHIWKRNTRGESSACLPPRLRKMGGVTFVKHVIKLARAPEATIERKQFASDIVKEIKDYYDKRLL